MLVVSRVIACLNDVLVDWFLCGNDDRDCVGVNAGLGFYAIELWHRYELCLFLCIQYVHKLMIDNTCNLHCRDEITNRITFDPVRLMNTMSQRMQFASSWSKILICSLHSYFVSELHTIRVHM